MKKTPLLGAVILLCISIHANGQSSGTILVGGDFDKFYPVTWHDPGWAQHLPTKLALSRMDVHWNSTWRGSLVSEFVYHTSQWGHGANDIRATIYYLQQPFIAGWRDATNQNSSQRIIIWLRGGGTTYAYSANGDVAPVVYDGVANPLPLTEQNGPAHTYITSVAPYVNSNGLSERSMVLSQGLSVLQSVGIGTTTPDAPLTVKGIIHSEEVRVDMTVPGPDYVFEPTYNLLPLSEVETYIKANKHLPEVPSAKQMEEEGLNLKEMNLLLLKKVEELTLYVIELKKENEKLNTAEERLKVLENKINEIESNNKK